MYKYLNFFNKKGEYANFEYDETYDKWIGRVDFGTVSEGIIEDFQLYILEEVYNTNSGQIEYTYPQIDNSLVPGPTGSTSGSIKLSAYFDPSFPVEDLFIYTFDLGPTTNTLSKLYDIEYNFAYDPGQTIGASAGNYPNIKNTTLSYPTPIQLNLAFQPSKEDGFSSVLYMEDSSGHIFAEILLYGEGEEEDERLRDLLQSIGYDLLPEDTKVFDISDVNEEGVDWILINNKRKELLLEYSNIFPYLGSYKALINAIKFFGYQNLRMKEYWLNVDAQSPYYGKYKQINITDVFDESANYITSGLVPSKIYKKTSKFGLFYDITVESGQYDEDGLPIAEEVFLFSPEEILIKIYALKKKLQNYFLPVNARIVDIIGEAVYFAKYECNVWNDQYRIDSIELGLKPKFTVLPEREGYLQDLRPLNFFGVPIGPDLTIGGSSNLLSWRVGLSSNDVIVGGILDGVQTYRLIVDVPTGSTAITLDTVIRRDPDTGQTVYKPWEVADSIIDNWKSTSYLKDNFVIYQEGGTSGIIRVVQKESIGDGTIFATWYSNTNVGPGSGRYSIPSITGGTATSINVSTGPSGTFGPSGAPMSYYGDAFIGYFDRINQTVRQLNDDEDIPIGYPIILRNDTFDITWDDANVTYNQIDQYDVTLESLLYSTFTVSQTISPNWVSPSTPVYIPVPNFPSNFPSQYVYTWENLGYYGYYQMQWIITKELTDTPEFKYDTGPQAIKDINELPLILPYVGTYKVELYLWDGYNTRSFLINENWIQVKMQDSDFIGWYQFRELDYEFDTKRYPVQSDSSRKPSEYQTNKNPLLTWDEYASTWDLPFHPNEEIGMAEISFNSLDSIEFYQNITNPSTNPLIDRFPYTYNLITELPTWENLYHLWWDGTGTKMTQWEINQVTGPTSHIFMTRGNTIVDLNSGLNVHYVQGPTGYTGATGATSLIGTTAGEIIVSNANCRTYMWNGTDWAYIIDKVDSYEIGNLVGTDKQNMLEIARHLNQVMPYESIDHPFLKDFIYYYNEEYTNTYGLHSYIRAVSKDFDSPTRHKLRLDNLVGDPDSYETVYFGYLGDIPTHFEIYQVSPTGPYGSILLPGMSVPYSIGSTNLTNLCDELNGPTAQSYNSLGDYEFNLVLGYSGWTGPSGPTSGATEVKIQGIRKDFTSNQEINVDLNGIIGTEYGRSLIKNPSWDGIRVLKYAQELPLCTVVNFTYDNSKVHGKKNPVWKLQKEGDLDFTDIYYNNKYFSYMFTERGSYTLTLTLEDTNGNKKTVTKKEIIKII